LKIKGWKALPFEDPEAYVRFLPLVNSTNKPAYSAVTAGIYNANESWVPLLTGKAGRREVKLYTHATNTDWFNAD
jgi:hypothetical protein